MTTPNLEAYCELMLEIRHRATAIAKLEKPAPELIPDFVRVELLVLQVRKILELIALGSMVANEAEYTNAYKKFEKHYHANLILNDIEKLNPDFYPKPADQTKSMDEGVNHHLEIKQELDESYLARSDFSRIYEQCGALLHAQNPYGASRDYAQYESNIRKWMKKIEKLLNIHVIRLINDNNYYLIHMNTEDGKPHGYTLSPNTNGI